MGPANHPQGPAQPTEQDLENARIRREIADRFAAEYAEVLALAQDLFGPGWLPSHRHFLLELEEEERVRYTGQRPVAAATVYTVKNEEGRARHFTKADDGKVTECESHQAGFGPMLFAPHPSRGFEHQGKWCPYHRYSLCWAAYELYEPKSAEELAALRHRREERKAERETKQWAEANPLLAWAERKPPTVEEGPLPGEGGASL